MTHHTTHRIARSAGVMLAVAAVTAPGASAISPDSVERNQAVEATPAVVVVQAPDSVDRNAAARQAGTIDKVTPDARDAANPRPIVNVPPVVERVTPASGMDWGDAAIGAGATLGLVLLAIGGAMAVGRHRAHGHGHGHLA
jgi:hypothetical protein